MRGTKAAEALFFMKPSFIQYVFAKDWPLKVYLVAAAILGVWVAVSICEPSMAMLDDWSDLLTFILTLLAAPALAVLIALLNTPLFLGPFYFLRAKLNGAPYKVGDRVLILVGPNRGRVVQVYKVWSERRQVLVDLKAGAPDVPNDAFSFTQVCRDTEAQL